MDKITVSKAWQDNRLSIAIVAALCSILSFFCTLASLIWYDVLDEVFLETIRHYAMLAESSYSWIPAIVNAFCLWVVTLMFFITRTLWVFWFALSGVSLLVLISTCWFVVASHVVVEFVCVLHMVLVKTPTDWFIYVRDKEGRISKVLENE